MGDRELRGPDASPFQLPAKLADGLGHGSDPSWPVTRSLRPTLQFLEGIGSSAIRRLERRILGCYKLGQYREGLKRQGKSLRKLYLRAITLAIAAAAFSPPPPPGPPFFFGFIAEARWAPPKSSFGFGGWAGVSSGCGLTAG